MTTYSAYSNIANGTTPSAYEAETLTLIASGRYDTEPSSLLKDLINTTIKGLKDDGVFALADCLYVRGVHESKFALQNWIKNAHNGTLSATPPTFTAKTGFSFNGSSSYIDNNYTPSTDAVNYALNSASIFLDFVAVPTATSKNPFGAYNTVSGNRAYPIFYTTGNDRFYFHSATYNGNINWSDGNRIGYTRNGTSVQGYVDGAASGAAVVASATAGLVGLSFYEGACNINGAATGYGNAQLGWSFYGANLNSTQVAALDTRMAYFFANVGGIF